MVEFLFIFRTLSVFDRSTVRSDVTFGHDIFRVLYVNDEYSTEDFAHGSVSVGSQEARRYVDYRRLIPENYSPPRDPLMDISSRGTISLETVKRAAELFESNVSSSGMEKQLALLQKSLSEYKVGNFDAALLLAWFITEASMNSLWKSHLEHVNKVMKDDRARIPSDRRERLTKGRDFTAFVVSENLELFEVIDHRLYREISHVRGLRNKIVHERNVKVGIGDAERAIEVARSLIVKLWDRPLLINLSWQLKSIGPERRFLR